MKRLKIISVLSFLFVVSSCFAQEDVVDIFKLGIFNPGVSYEKRIGKYQTVSGQAFINIALGFAWSSSLGSEFSSSFDPALAVQYRYYYNAKSRHAKGKRTEMNTMNYIGPAYKMLYADFILSDSYYGEEGRRPMHSIGAVWGFQRNYKNRISLDLAVGPGYIFAKSNVPGENGEIVRETKGAFNILLLLNMGIWLNKRQ